VVADMMSDEEKRGEEYVRHQPEYRSERFNSFLDKLDLRGSKKQSSHSRFKRSIGTPIKKAVPVGIQKWMVKASAEVAVHSDEDGNEHEQSSDCASERSFSEEPASDSDLSPVI
jgi:hypothetical protein